jgi:hypothetical protein
MRLSSKLFAVAISALLMALGTTAVSSADLTRRISVPDYCSQCDVNCVQHDAATIRIRSDGGRERQPKQDPNGNARDPGDDDGQCGLWRLPWLNEQQQVGRTVPIRFSGSAA